MIKRPPSRNNRSKGFKVKHVLQICLLLGICFWLIYQVKHSHDKKKELDEKDAKISVRAQNGNVIVDFGRKALHPHLEKVTHDEKHNEDDDEETIAEEESNKIKETKHEQKQVKDEKQEGEEQEEDEREENTKTEEAEREGNKHEKEERKEGNMDEQEEREEGNRNEGEEREEGTRREEEEREEGTRHEEEEREEEGNKHNEEEREEEEGNKLEEEEREGEGNKLEEEEREEEEEGNKHDDEEQEEETKSDATEDDGRGGGDDEIDERDQQKIEGEADHEDDFVDEEKEREEVAEKESGIDEGGEKEDQVYREASTENEDHDGGTQNDHEAREVHYKADDASSAVTHDAQNMGIEPEKISSDSSNENSVISELELEKNSSNNNPKDINGDQKNSTTQLGEGAMAENNHPLNVKTDEEKSDETIKTEGQPLKKATDNQQLSTDKLVDLNTVADKNPAGGSTGISGTSRLKETLDTSDLNKPQNQTVDGGDNVEASKLKSTEVQQVNNNKVSGSRESDSTSTVSNKMENNGTVAKDSYSSTTSEPDGSNKTIKHEVTAEVEADSGSSSTTKETEEAAQGENSDIKTESDGTYDNSGSSTTDGNGAAVHDTIDSSDSLIGQDEKEARIDLDTLPENSAEGVNSRDAAAE